MITDDFIKAESLAEEFIQKICDAREQLQQGPLDKSIALLEELEQHMRIVLAIGERYDTDYDGDATIH